MHENCDFRGWATRNDLKCSDGRVIRDGAFKHCDGMQVPMVWNHMHDSPENTLGYAILEHRDNEGVYAYGYFNNTDMGQNAKELVRHGDIKHLSICANKLKQIGSDVVHGVIRELSLVYAGANPGAYIEEVMAHSDLNDFEAIITTDDSNVIELEHSEERKEDDMTDDKLMEHADSEETLKDVFNTLTEKQKTAVYALVGELNAELNGDDDDDKEDSDDMKHNVFDKEQDNEMLMHAEKIDAAIKDGKRYGSLKESFLQHGITNIETLFPDEKLVNNPPIFYKREDDWVAKVMNGVHRTPFSRIKSTYADITGDEARAKGYTKGKKKIEEVIAVLKRTTTPTTIYKKQKLDRDDVIDITDFDVIAWLKGEMRMMLEEEIARAILVGDGRDPSSDDKINEQNIRPIWTDDVVYTIKATVNVAENATADQKAKAVIRTAVKTRKDYKGSGNPTFFTSEDVLTDMLLMEDNNGRVIYDSVDKLATAMRVKTIVTAPVLENLTRQGDDGNTYQLAGLIVNLQDYNVGADKGGAVSMFDDFDIDYNAQKYLIETRISGALTKPKSAMAIEFKVAGAAAASEPEQTA